MGAAETLSPVLPDAVEEATHRLLHAAARKKRRFATAESCTGGLLASLLTDVEGVSHVFERGFIVYSEDAKCELLGVDRALVKDFGAVSREVAVAMAEGAIRASRADIALAITGFAGSRGRSSVPGLVHFACATRGGATVHREEHFGDIGRGGTRLQCLRVSLAMLQDAVDAGTAGP
ncbi:MAG: CinA family protein [Sphingomonadaceae bacterium]